MLHFKDEFLDFLLELGLVPSGRELVIGKIARADVINKSNGKQDGSYCLNISGDQCFGWAENHQLGTGVVKFHSGQKRSKPQLIIEPSFFSEADLLREAQKHSRAKERAQKIWDSAWGCDWSHPYLAKKGFTQSVQHLLGNLRCADYTTGGKKYKDCIIMPIHDCDRTLHSLQAISMDGDKFLLWQAKKQSNFFAIKDFENVDTVILCEGLATGLSIQLRAPREAVIVCIDAGNLCKVAVQMKALGKRIIVGADHDDAGQKAAQAVLSSIGGKIFLPPVFGTDWNDFYEGKKE